MTTDALFKKMNQWRHYLHENPETAFEEKNTAKFISKKLIEMGYDISDKIGGTGVVGTLKKGEGSKMIGIRAEMDALNVQEKTNLSYYSKKDGKMHASGHDGHIATAHDAANLLATTKHLNRKGRFIIQP